VDDVVDDVGMLNGVAQWQVDGRWDWHVNGFSQTFQWRLEQC